MIKAATIHLAILLGTALLRAGAPLTAAESILLWPESAPGAKGNAPADKPAITVHLPAPEKANGAAIVICPGGGYRGLVVGAEGHIAAEWLGQHGVTGIVLEY